MTSTNLPTKSTILKTDVLGRVHTPATQREAILDAFEQCGMSGAAFCKLHGLRYTTFASWRQKRRAKDKNPGARPLECDGVTGGPFFEEIELSAPSAGGISSAAGLRIELPGGAGVQISEAGQFPLAAALLRYLEASC